MIQPSRSTLFPVLISTTYKMRLDFTDILDHNKKSDPIQIIVFEPRPRPPRYLFIHVFGLPAITSSYKNPNPIMVRSSCMHDSHAFLLCMHIFFPRASFLASCISPTSWFSPQSACAQQAPNTEIITHPVLLPNSSFFHYLCQRVIHFNDSLALRLSLTDPFGHIFHELCDDWVL